MSNYYVQTKVEFTNWPKDAMDELNRIMNFLESCEDFDKDSESYNNFAQHWPWLKDWALEAQEDFYYFIDSNGGREIYADSWYYDSGIDSPTVCEIVRRVMLQYKLPIDATAELNEYGHDDRKYDGHVYTAFIRNGYIAQPPFQHDIDAARELTLSLLRSIYIKGEQALADALLCSERDVLCLVEEHTKRTIDADWRFINLRNPIFKLLQEIVTSDKTSDAAKTVMHRIINTFNLNELICQTGQQ